MAEKRKELKELKLSALVTAADNPRTVNKQSQKYLELVKSIEMTGVAMPLLVRPHPTKKNKYEIRAGHRRYVAAKEAKVETVPALVHYGLTDVEAYELTIIENCAREDLTPIEEANTVTRMLELNNGDADAVADKLDKTANWVRTRARVGKSLSDKWLEFLSSDWGWSAAHLEQIARLPMVLQDEVLEAVSGRERDRWHQMTVEDLRIELRKEFHKLSIAIFDVAGCNKCSKRTSSQAFLFPDVAGEDYCLDPACWDQHLKDYMQLKIDEAIADGCWIMNSSQSEFKFDFHETQVFDNHWPGRQILREEPEDKTNIQKIFVVSSWSGPSFGDILWYRKEDENDSEPKNYDNTSTEPLPAKILNERITNIVGLMKLDDRRIKDIDAMLIVLLLKLSDEYAWVIESEEEFANIFAANPDDMLDADKKYRLYESVFKFVQRVIKDDLSVWESEPAKFIAKWLDIDISDIDLEENETD